MRSLQDWLADFLRNEEGPTAVEYAVLLALIVVICLSAISVVGTSSSATFREVGRRINGSGS